MSELPVLVEDLVVRYGSKTAVAGATFSVKPGEIYGLLGPNGAGKSSVVKVLVGLVQPASGRARIFGRSPSDVKAKMRIGYVPEEVVLFDSLTPREYLEFVTSVRRMDSATASQRFRKLAEAFGLSEHVDTPIGALSKGSRQKVALIAGLTQALASAEELLRGFPAGLGQLLYPLPFAHLLAFAIGQAAPPVLPALAAASYAAAAYAASKWLVRRVLEVSMGGLPPALAAAPLALKTAHPWLAVVKKDLRLASRSPTHAFTVFAPVAYGVYMAVTWASEWAFALGLASLTLASAILLLSTEALAEQATGPLPLTRRLLVSSKVSLAAGVYLLSTGASAAAAAASGKPALPLALLGLAYAPTVAASVIVLSLLAFKVSESSAPPGDLYSRLARNLLPLIAGFLLLLIPAAVYGLLWLLKHPDPLLPMALAAVVELAVAVVALATSK